MKNSDSSTHAIPVIYFHSVAPQENPAWVLNFLTLKLIYFEEVLKYLVKNNYKSLFLEEYYHYKKDGKINHKNCICLTFDDGYLDNWIYAYPLLKKYNIKATIFVNPASVDLKESIRKNLQNYWDNQVAFKELERWGYLSWDEMREMVSSGLVDIQSHTLTHTRYFVSDRLTGFHHPGADCLYPVGNIFPDRVPYYIEDKEFEKLIPYGFPFCEEKSAIIARKIEINSDFINEIVALLSKKIDWYNNYKFVQCLKFVQPIYNNYINKNEVIKNIEAQEEYQLRVTTELQLSKSIIEHKLNKKVKFCGWPHGDNTMFTHQTALSLGYLATTKGNMDINVNDYTRIERFGLNQVRNSIILTRLKMHYKISSYQHIFPYYQLKTIYNILHI